VLGTSSLTLQEIWKNLRRSSMAESPKCPLRRGSNPTNGHIRCFFFILRRYRLRRNVTNPCLAKLFPCLFTWVSIGWALDRCRSWALTLSLPQGYLPVGHAELFVLVIFVFCRSWQTAAHRSLCSPRKVFVPCVSCITTSTVFTFLGGVCPVAWSTREGL